MGLHASPTAVMGFGEQGGAADSHISAIHRRLDTAVADLEQATHWVLATHADDPRRVAAGATPYLQLAGAVTGGWLMAIGARRAADAATVERYGQAFCAAKLRTARFFADNFLGASPSLLNQITRGGNALADFDAELDL